MLHLLPLFLMFAGPTGVQQAPPVQPPVGGQTAPAQSVKRSSPPPPYNEQADAGAAVEAAIKAAATDDIRVLINWGANDDPGSKAFAGIRRAPELAGPAYFSDEYKVVNVDIGHVDKNLDLARTYGVKLAADALPALTVLDAAGRVLANTTAAALRQDGDASAIDPAKVAAFLSEHKAPAPDAIAPFEAALNRAKKEDKSVFVWFSAPW